MSANGNPPILSGDGGLSAELSDAVDAVATPTITSPTDSPSDVEVTPVATTKLREVTQFDATTNTDLCGNAETETGAEQPARLVIEGILVKSQKEQLDVLRTTGGRAYVTSDVYTGAITFDQLTITQKTEENTGRFSVDGRTLEGPVITFQLQAKREDV